MTNEQAGIALATEQSDVLQDMLTKVESLASGWRDQSIPEGALLDEIDLPGQQVRWRKQKSMVRAGATPLPERFEAFDRNGISRMLPTAQMSRMLSKPRADAPNERAFHTHTRGMTRTTCPICPEPPVPIDTKCQFCIERSGTSRPFFTEEQAYMHKRMKHELELEAFERTLERTERIADRDAARATAEAMIALAQGIARQAPHAEAIAQAAEAQTAETYPCPLDNYVGASAHALAVHTSIAHKEDA